MTQLYFNMRAAVGHGRARALKWCLKQQLNMNTQKKLYRLYRSVEVNLGVLQLVIGYNISSSSVWALLLPSIGCPTQTEGGDGGCDGPLFPQRPVAEICARDISCFWHHTDTEARNITETGCMKQPEVCIWLTEITVLMVKIYHRKESEDQSECCVFCFRKCFAFCSSGQPQLKIVLLINWPESW